MRSEGFQQDRQRENKIIERRSRVRGRSRGEVFEIVVTHDQPRMLGAHSHTRHPRITIRVSEINVPGDENVPIICAPRCQDQHA